MKIGIASDHRGVILKEKIKNYLNGKYQIIDYVNRKCRLSTICL